MLTREGLTIERFAEVMAHVQHYPAADTAEVLDRLGLDPAAWEAASQAWTAALLEEVRAEGKDLAQSFGSAFAAARTRLRQEAPLLDSLGPRRGNASSTSGVEASVETTAEGLPLVVADPLPFHERSSRPFLDALERAPKSEPLHRRDLDETMTPLPVSQMEDPTLPFQKTLSGKGPPVELTVTQYASLTAELNVHPERDVQILARYGVTSHDQRRALDTAWAARFAADESTRRSWDDLRRKYEAWLLSRLR